LTNHIRPTISRRAALHGLGVAGLAAAGGLLAPVATDAAHAAADVVAPETDPNVASDLVVVDQMGTGTWEGENCGPASAVIALAAVGQAPASYVPGEAGASPGGNARAVEDMRVLCGLSPSGRPTAKSVDYWGAYLEDLEQGVAESGGSTDQVRFRTGVAAAADGAAVILNVHHGALIEEADADYGHFVVAQGTDSDGHIRVSDPGRAQSLGITGYSRDHLVSARKGKALIVS